MTQYPLLDDYLGTDIQPAQKLPAFLEDLFGRINKHLSEGGKILLLALTKKSSEEISNYMIAQGYKAFYLHSEIDTMQRRDIIQKLKNGHIDILVGVNLLREGIDLPEVSMIAILDADKEGFLRSTTSLIQIIGRAARNPKGEVVLYADRFTEAMVKSLRETYRRRHIQQSHNKAHNITPQATSSGSKGLSIVKTDDDLDLAALQSGKKSGKKLKKMTKKEKEMIRTTLKKELDAAIAERRFEDAAVIRDQLTDLDES